MCLTKDQTKLIRKLLGQADITAFDADEFQIATELFEILKEDASHACDQSADE